jgi:hypothetical protein
MENEAFFFVLRVKILTVIPFFFRQLMEGPFDTAIPFRKKISTVIPLIRRGEPLLRYAKGETTLSSRKYFSTIFFEKKF